MSPYVLLRMPDATLLAERPVLPAKDALAVSDLPGLLAALREERASLAEARAEAVRAGHDEGRAAGEALGRAEAAEAGARAAGEALAALAEARAAARDEAADLALRIVRRVLPDALGDTLLPGLIRSALEEAQADAPHAVRVHPSEAEAAAKALAGTGVALVPDDALAPGQAVLETEAGGAEAGLDARLDVLAEALRG